ncbi:MAG TPA: adenylyl-sulfate kinase [Steroidobacteraceae bacterium]|nr:adenylyl-sulfate kinase [Steroidobacteraceae bacterium]
MTDLIAPYGGELKELYLIDSLAAAVRAQSRDWPSWDLTARQMCDIELLLNGAFSPLGGFMCRRDYDPVVRDMRLADATLWPIPITLDVTHAVADRLSEGLQLALRDPTGVLLAVLEVKDIWVPDRRLEATSVFGSDDIVHPGVNHLLNRTNPVYVGGPLRGVAPPTHYDFRHLRDTPRELTLRAAHQTEANLLLHPVVGMTRPGDVDHYTRVRCYEHIYKRYPEHTTALSLLPLAMRLAGPREALWHAIIRRNYGCSHFIVGRDHAGPGKDSRGSTFYGPYEAQELMRRFQPELGIEMVPFREMVYVQDLDKYVPVDETRPGQTVLTISGSELRRRLQEGTEIPPWFSYAEVVEELRRTHPPRHQQGFTVFFTGLSGAGKSTLAHAVLVRLLERGARRVTLLDGDIVRKHLSSELGFSREHRDLNILRIGFVASEIVKNGGIALCAPIAPYTETRRRVREMVEPYGGFIEVYVSTPLEVCEQRDRKGLYSKARAGLIKEFTGVSDVYEVPVSPEIDIDTREVTPDMAANEIIVKLESLGYLR